MDLQSSDWPAEFVCPIAKSVMADPVIVSTGESYERRCIEAWFALGQTLCVKKYAPVDRNSIFPNDNLRNAIAKLARSKGIRSLPRPPSREVALHFANCRMSEIQEAMEAAATNGPGIYQGEYGFSTMDDSSGGPWRNEFIDQRESGSRVHNEPGIRSDFHRSSGSSRGSGSASVRDYSMYSSDIRNNRAGIRHHEIRDSAGMGNIDDGRHHSAIGSINVHGIRHSAMNMDHRNFDEIGDSSAGFHDQYWGMPNTDWMNDAAPIANYQQNHHHQGNDETERIHRPRFSESEQQQRKTSAANLNSPSPPSNLRHAPAEEAVVSSGRSPSSMNPVAMAYSASMPRASTPPWPAGSSSTGPQSEGPPVKVDDDDVAGFPIPLVTRPSSYAEEMVLQQQQPQSAGNPSSTITSQSVESLAAALINRQRQAAAMAEVRRLTRVSAENRLRLCDSQMIKAILPLLQMPHASSPNPAIASALNLLCLEEDMAMGPASSSALIDAVAAVANLSIEKPNKVKLVREGVVPRLIGLLTVEGEGAAELEEAQHHAVGAIFGLAMDEENRSFLGVIGVIPPLLEMLRRSNGSRDGRRSIVLGQKAMESQKDTVLALYQLSLQRMNASKIAKYPGAVSLLLDLAETPETPNVIAAGSLHVLHNVATCPDGHKELLQLKALKRLVNLMEDRKLSNPRLSSASNPKPSGSAESTMIAEQAASVLLILSKGSSSFWFLVRRTRRAGRPGIEELLQNLVHRGSPRAQKKASALLERMKQMMTTSPSPSPTWESDDDQEFNWQEDASSAPLYNNHLHNMRSRWNPVGSATEQTNHSSAF